DTHCASGWSFPTFLSASSPYTMIPLRLRTEATGWGDGLAIVRLLSREADVPTVHDVILDDSEDGASCYRSGDRQLRIFSADAASLEGNIALLNAPRRTLQRLIRPDSVHNTFLVTERCDQLCVMCSQPPNAAEWNIFDLYLQAAQLA